MCIRLNATGCSNIIIKESSSTGGYVHEIVIISSLFQHSRTVRNFRLYDVP
jgi:hypothetical protein